MTGGSDKQVLLVIRWRSRFPQNTDMSKETPKTKLCPECKRLTEAEALRPLSFTVKGTGLRRVCPDCYARVTALRKAVRANRIK